MATTASGLFYPSPGDAVNVNGHIQQAVQSVENVLVGKAVDIPTVETRTNAAYGLLTTPDLVQNVVVPAKCLLQIRYQALWKGDGSSSGVMRAAIFVSGNQMKVAENNADPQIQAAGGFGTFYRALHTMPMGLLSADSSSSDASEVVTGQAIGSVAPAWSVEMNGAQRTVGSGAWGATSTVAANVPFGGPCELFVGAGTYDISVQFKSSAGTITVKNRHLWVRVLQFL